MKQLTLGLIVGNRGFFPAHLCETGRKTILKVLEAEGIKVVALGPDDTTYGSVESVSDAEKCAALFKKHAEEIDGILVTLPNFGDERAVANAIRWSGLDVPVLVQASPDDMTKMTVADRRDSFCGKMSVCNNLRQYGIKYSLTSQHTVAPDSAAFLADLRQFVGVCRTVGGLKGARVGLIGARPANFITVRFSEKLFERAGISVETIDLSEIFGKALKLAANDAKVKAKVEEIRAYVPVRDTPVEALVKMAQLGVVIDDWMAANKLSASAIQCWTSMEEFYGVVPVHDHEHDEQQPGAVGLRDRHRRRDRHVRHGARLGQAQRAGGLEQQLRRRPRQVRHLPLLQPAEGCLCAGPDQAGRHHGDGLPGHHRGHGGQGEHLRHGRRPRQGRSVHLLPRLDRRLHRPHPGLRG